jgi:ribA/ribD-fused uncharacterized protein
MELHGLDTEERICFYEQDFYVFSNFSSFRVVFDGIDFMTSEHAYHYQRFVYNGADSYPVRRIEGSQAARSAILAARSAHDAFKIAQKNKSYQRPDWDSEVNGKIVKVSVMDAIVEAKARQNEYVLYKLMRSGNRELVENSWRDNFWGEGPDGNGRNELGRCWMRLRDKIRLEVLEVLKKRESYERDFQNIWTGVSSPADVRRLIDALPQMRKAEQMEFIEGVNPDSVFYLDNLMLYDC